LTLFQLEFPDREKNFHFKKKKLQSTKK